MYSVIAFDGQVYGPVDVRTLLAWCREGRIVANTHLVETLSGRTFRAVDMPELAAALNQGQAAMAQTPPGQQVQSPYASTQAPFSQPHYPPQNVYVPGQQLGQFPSGAPAYGGFGVPKSKSTALLLCFILGPLGAHRFYLGHNRTGFAMLVIGLLSLANCFFLAISILWCTIDFCRIAAGQMPDGQGTIPR